MFIAGLQNLTLLDFPETLACTVFTGGCNLRCPFCHNAALVLQPERQSRLQSDALFSFLQKRRNVLEGVCITGGEPLLHPDLPDLLAEIRALGYRIKLDTNGCYPDRLQAVLQANLVDMVAMDVKNCPDRYAETVDLPDFDLAPVQQSLDLLRQSPVPYWLRTTVVRELHTLDDIRSLSKWLAGTPRFALQHFVDSGHCITPGLHSVDVQTMQQMADILRQTIDLVEIKGIDTVV